MQQSVVGIDDMALHIPRLYLPIEVLAEKRNLEYAKLNKGLGLERMAIPDVHEDAATMAANAVKEIIDRNAITPNEIGRLYLGTESALDGAKPTATYVLEMLRRYYRAEYGTDCFENCDVVDLTFACVGGVDAMHNTLDWIRGDQSRIGIVVTSDFAKYELGSGGEYTQGAGAIAMLLKHNPRLIAIENKVGVGTRGVHDFYKPLRAHSKKEIIEEILQYSSNTNDNADEIINNIPDQLDTNGVIDDNNDILTLHKETPVFDGQYSNWTYQNRIKEAYLHYTKQDDNEKTLIDRADRIIFHLPYAYHGRRICSELYKMQIKGTTTQEELTQLIGTEPIANDFENKEDYEKAKSKYLRGLTKTPMYKSFVTEKLEKAERASSKVGNMYACSIFLALMSSMESDLQDSSDLTDSTLGFVSYGSGSKSKVFSGIVQPQWKEVVKDFNLFSKLDSCNPINYETYERLHRKQQTRSIHETSGEFAIEKIGTEGTRLGARYYQWVE